MPVPAVYMSSSISESSVIYASGDPVACLQQHEENSLVVHVGHASSANLSDLYPCMSDLYRSEAENTALCPFHDRTLSDRITSSFRVQVDRDRVMTAAKCLPVHSYLTSILALGFFSGAKTVYVVLFVFQMILA